MDPKIQKMLTELLEKNGNEKVKGVIVIVDDGDKTGVEFSIKDSFCKHVSHCNSHQKVLATALIEAFVKLLSEFEIDNHIQVQILEANQKIQ